jgi:hypothetical protein
MCGLYGLRQKMHNRRSEMFEECLKSSTHPPQPRLLDGDEIAGLLAKAGFGEWKTTAPDVYSCLWRSLVFAGSLERMRDVVEAAKYAEDRLQSRGWSLTRFRPELRRLSAALYCDAGDYFRILEKHKKRLELSLRDLKRHADLFDDQLSNHQKQITAEIQQIAGGMEAIKSGTLRAHQIISGRAAFDHPITAKLVRYRAVARPSARNIFDRLHPAVYSDKNPALDILDHVLYAFVHPIWKRPHGQGDSKSLKNVGQFLDSTAS